MGGGAGAIRDMLMQVLVTKCTPCLGMARGDVKRYVTCEPCLAGSEVLQVIHILLFSITEQQNYPSDGEVTEKFPAHHNN